MIFLEILIIIHLKKGHRAQIDRSLYKSNMQNVMLNTKNLTVAETQVNDILLIEQSLQDDENKAKLKVGGVILESGEVIRSRSVVVTTGTFLRANINIGLEVRPAGRLGDRPSVELGNSLERIGFRMGRLKTGTPPRLDGRTIDYRQLEVVHPDNPPAPFSFMNERVLIDAHKQLPTHLTYTNEKVAKIIKDTLHLNRHVREETRGPRLFKEW